MLNMLMSVTPEIAITTEMVTPLVDQVIGVIAVVLPIGMTIFGIIAGVKLGPRLISSFFHG